MLKKDEKDEKDEFLETESDVLNIFNKQDSQEKVKESQIIKFSSNAVLNSVDIPPDNVVPFEVPEEKKYERLKPAAIAIILAAAMVVGLAFVAIADIFKKEKYEREVLQTLCEQYYCGNVYEMTGSLNYWEYTVNPTDYASRIKESKNVDASIYFMFEKSPEYEFGEYADKVIKSVFEDTSPEIVNRATYYESVVGKKPGETDDDVREKYFDNIKDILVKEYEENINYEEKTSGGTQK